MNLLKICEKLYNSTQWSIAGLIYAYKNELAIKLELLMVIILTPLAFYLALDINQLLWLLTSVILVLLVEIINSAIEATIDRIGLEQHELSRHAKDLGSAAVYIALLLMCLVWGLIIRANYIIN